MQILGFVSTTGGPVGINGNSSSAVGTDIEWNLLWRPLEGLSV